MRRKQAVHQWAERLLRVNARRSFVVAVSAALAAACMPGCGPKIRSFSVEPRRACREDSIRVAYQVAGKPQMQISSTGADPETLTYTLIVQRHGKTRYARQDVVRFGVEQEWPLVFTTEPLGADSLVAAETLPESNWNSSARLVAVSAQSGRSIWAMHGGRLALLSGNGSPIGAFNGLSLAGPWELKAALLPGEVIGDPQHAPPDRLRILTKLQCRGEE